MTNAFKDHTRTNLINHFLFKLHLVHWIQSSKEEKNETTKRKENYFGEKYMANHTIIYSTPKNMYNKKNLRVHTTESYRHKSEITLYIVQYT